MLLNGNMAKSEGGDGRGGGRGVVSLVKISHVST